MVGDIAQYRNENGNHSNSGKALQASMRAFIEVAPILTVAAMLSLIFGGCCSNVYALEAIIKYGISLLRYFGSRYLYGKRYARLQAIAVIFLSVGVVLAAWSDAQDKIVLQRDSGRPAFNSGLIILLVAQVLSAIMGLIWLFGNSLARGTLFGAIIVFGAGALYSFGSAPKQDSGGKKVVYVKQE
ncbi:UDP-N-acetylglucosamine transporter YEA4 [Metarhizium acridum CQMa 102]|uniref:UDP-N-acetylglucosamine transporter YEA4 n=1 Tax=Metarhizium acridum (strain CQMa 102) TaxID=655827 RepID=E9EGS5_METAQ|nr:UDP-N-acetylglucosamine transporter YEA4 [Metarhizium acridum CQMa 102]EFY84862.1 UDP-N-acetylglucosamine transporter YEA4 [Metarhizium acridum CQMa 102]